MDNIERSIVYLRGLIDGGGYDDDTQEGRIFNAIADVLENISDELNILSSRGRYCEDMIEEILDEELEYGDDEFDEEFDEDDFVELECPNCHDIVLFDNDTYNNTENIICPNCNATI